MVALSIRFLAGRYHATGWDHHVNEGTVEWPPSPWRLLRALVAASHRLVQPPSDDELTAVLSPLVSNTPVYAIPAYTEGHTRHYMPIDNKGLPGDKAALIYDAFVAPGSGADAADGELTVAWPDAELSDESFELLSTLCGQLSYLGRAESWAEIRPIRKGREAAIGANCVPTMGTPSHLGVRLMAPTLAEDHARWYQKAKASGGKPSALPESVLDVLRQDTADLRRHGWSSVPGTRWVVYDHQPKQCSRAPTTEKHSMPHIVLCRLDGVVLPLVGKTLQMGEILHSALVAQSKRDNGTPLEVFTGTKGVAARGDHCAVMPFDVNGDGKIDRALLVARRGFDDAALATIRRVRRLWGLKSLELHLTVMGEWSDDEVARLSGVRGGGGVE